MLSLRTIAGRTTTQLSRVAARSNQRQCSTLLSSFSPVLPTPPRVGSCARRLLTESGVATHSVKKPANGVPVVTNLDSETGKAINQGVDFLKKMLQTKVAIYAVVGLISVPLAYYIFFHETEEGITDEIVKRFEEGVDELTEKDKYAQVERKELHKELRMMLRPESMVSKYLVILGEKGVGKSTAVRQTLSELKEKLKGKPRGTVYVMTPPAGGYMFLEELSETIGLREAVDVLARFRRVVSGVSKQEGSDRKDFDAFRDQLLKKLKVVGRAYKKKNGHPPVLVIDGADILYKENPKFLAELQTFAKNGADDSTFLVVFVMSEKAAYELLEAHSHSSRGSIFMIGEVPEKEAVAFLVSNGIDKEDAKDAVKRITGGRFALLQDYLDDRKKGLTNDIILENCKAKTRYVLLKLSLSPADKLFQALLNGSLTADAALGMLNKDQEKFNALTNANILVVNPKTSVVTFNCRHVQTFFHDACSKAPVATPTREKDDMLVAAPTGRKDDMSVAAPTDKC